jgi:hypothetical protein
LRNRIKNKKEMGLAGGYHCCLCCSYPLCKTKPEYPQPKADS